MVLIHQIFFQTLQDILALIKIHKMSTNVRPFFIFKNLSGLLFAYHVFLNGENE